MNLNPLIVTPQELVESRLFIETGVPQNLNQVISTFKCNRLTRAERDYAEKNLRLAQRSAAKRIPR